MDTPFKWTKQVASHFGGTAQGVCMSWPGRTALCGMLTYSALATLYLLYLGIRGNWVGPLLWPAVVLHAAITILLGRAWFMSSKTGGQNNHASE
jgi:hypothetical protein